MTTEENSTAAQFNAREQGKRLRESRALFLMHKPDNFADFLKNGFTTFDQIAKTMSYQLVNEVSGLFALLIYLFENMATASESFLEQTKTLNNKWVKHPVTLSVGLINIVLVAVKSVLSLLEENFLKPFLAPLLKFVLRVALRAVSTPLGLLSAPFYLAGQTICNSATPEKTAVKGGVITSAVFCVALCAALKAGVFTPAVLGTSTLAVSLIALAWPAIVGTGVVSLVGAVGLLGHGLYKKYCRSEEEYTRPLCNQ